MNSSPQQDDSGYFTALNSVQLAAGYRLLWYRIEKVLGRGSFGVTYLVTDTNLERQVAIKEYFPVELAARHGDTVRPINDDCRTTYQWGLNRFIQEARTLAKFRHPNIAGVHTVFEANGTAYMVMEYERGDSLKDLVRRGAIVSEAEILGILVPILDGLAHVHKLGYIHRDIKPGNIFVRADGSPVLLDFGSARMRLKTQPSALTALVTHGYAPYEQYDGENQNKQGPWTDIYALGATLYRVVAGKRPVDVIARANARLEKRPDPLIPATDIASHSYSERFLRAIDAALALLPEDRPQDIPTWSKMLPVLTQPRNTELTAQEPVLATDPQIPRAEEPEATRDTTSQGNVRLELSVHPDDKIIKDVRPKPGRARWIFIPVLLVTILGIALAVIRPTQSDLEQIRNEWLPLVVSSLTSEQETQDEKVAVPVVEPQMPTAEPRAPTVEVPQTLPHPKPPLTFQDPLPGGAKGPEMVELPAGSFRMGDIQGVGRGYEKPVHTVQISSPFAISKHEITFGQYDRFAKATGRELPKARHGKRGRHPVVNVSWNDAVAYAEWLSEQTGQLYRLPTEAEWEYAARAGTETTFWWGNEIGKNRANCNGCGSRWDHKDPAPVGSFAANPFGLHDTAGNVSEWVRDCDANDYRGAPLDGSAWVNPKCPERVFRGGGWNDEPSKLRSAYRNWDGPELKYSYVGFRLVRELQ